MGLAALMNLWGTLLRKLEPNEVDANFTTLANAIDGKSPLAGPGPTGDFSVKALTATQVNVASSTASDFIGYFSNTNTSAGHGVYVNVAASGTGIPLRVDIGGVPKLQVAYTGDVTMSGAISTGPLTINGPSLAIESTGGQGSMMSGIDSYTGGKKWRVGHITSIGQLQFSCDSTSSQVAIDAAGNLLVGAVSGVYHEIKKVTAGSNAGNQCLKITGTSQVTAYFADVAGGTWGSAANCAVFLNKDGITSRSINAGGTINASGADYAEYECKSDTCGDVAKGQIIGFNANGEVTDKWSEAISFGVKSTQPNLVGGDTWGNEDTVGKRPEQPIYQAPKYTGAPSPGAEPQEPVLVLPTQSVQQVEEVDLTFAVRTAQWQENCAAQQVAHAAAVTQYQSALPAWQNAQALFVADKSTHQTLVDSAEAAHAESMEQYAVDSAEFETRLEVARQQVDRIAYSGKVPVNVTGASVGDYIVAVQAGEEISGEAVAKPSFDQYQQAVGRVRRILLDGRAEIAVLVH